MSILREGQMGGVRIQICIHGPITISRKALWIPAADTRGLVGSASLDQQQPADNLTLWFGLKGFFCLASQLRRNGNAAGRRGVYKRPQLASCSNTKTKE
ncbi:uncharacterized protein TrAFT101_000307 [Trichoderma asperellum]|uniref:uncharacterized protein n=1 Tax=Trichoderma asperellum TaxID=101201 RepID=UPI003321C795|nr:hypothetical protein TrAFT101_000307 [Trichoderma asperellum]